MNHQRLILIVIGNLDVGGAQMHLLQVLPRLKKQGFNVCVYVTNCRGELANILEDQHVRVIAPPFSKQLSRWGRFSKPMIYFLSMFKLIILILRYRPMVVHYFLPGSYVLGAVCGWISRCRCMVMSRRSRNLYQKKQPVIARMERWLHNKMTVILATSKKVEEDLIEEGVPVPKLGIIYNGVDLDCYQSTFSTAQIYSDLSLPHSTFVMIMVANLFPYKGHHDLLYALSEIKEQLPKPWRLLIVGADKGIQTELEALTVALGLMNRVLFLGMRHDVSELLSIAQLGILSSHEEGFSNAILEYMAAELPIVVTDVGGNAEAVIDQETGWVVPAHDPKQLAKAILSLAENNELREKLAKGAKHRAEHLFSLKYCVLQYAQLYQALLDSNIDTAIAGVK